MSLGDWIASGVGLLGALIAVSAAKRSQLHARQAQQIADRIMARLRER